MDTLPLFSKFLTACYISAFDVLDAKRYYIQHPSTLTSMEHIAKHALMKRRKTRKCCQNT